MCNIGGVFLVTCHVVCLSFDIYVTDFAKRDICLLRINCEMFLLAHSVTTTVYLSKKIRHHKCEGRFRMNLFEFEIQSMSRRKVLTFKLSDLQATSHIDAADMDDEEPTITVQTKNHGSMTCKFFIWYVRDPAESTCSTMKNT